MENPVYHKDVRNRYVRIILIAGCITFMVIVVAAFYATLQFYDVPTHSMEPTLDQGDRVVEVPVFGIRYFHRGSLVAFHLPYDPDNSGLARVVGLPGDYVQVKGGRLVINQKPVYETYLKSKAPALRLDFPSNADSLVDNPELRRLQNTMYGEMIFNDSVKVPEGYYFLLGDNRGQSLDSRTYGPVPRDLVFALPVYVSATNDPAKHPHFLHSADLEVKE